jgi:hypothetical protein
MAEATTFLAAHNLNCIWGHRGQLEAWLPNKNLNPHLHRRKILERRIRADEADAAVVDAGALDGARHRS